MKNILKYILIALVIFPLACSDEYLTVNPSDTFSAGNFDPNLHITGIYNTLKGEYVSQYSHNHDALTPACLTNNRQWRGYIEGSATANSDRTWRSWYEFYTGIYLCNDFLSRSPDYDWPNAETQGIYEGEVSFIRAFYYHLLVSNFGDVPFYLDNAKVSSEEAKKMTRTPAAEVYAQIWKDLDFAETHLKTEPRLVGTITKGAVIALKSRIHLLNNNWQGVVDECEKVMNLGIYDLYTANPNDSLDFWELFHYENENNVEVIWDVQFRTGEVGEGNRFQVTIGTQYTGADFGFQQSHGTQYLMDNFERRDGAPVPTGSYDFSNRDYRMYHSIIYPGSFFNGAEYKPGFKSYNTSRTHYRQRKYVIEGNLNNEIITLRFDSPGNFIMIRYADILLSYIEAKNELSGPSTAIVEMLNRIRRRGGLQDIDPGISDKAAFRQIIHKERMIELIFEGRFYYDMKRWGKAKTLPGGVGPAEFVANNQPLGYQGTSPIYTYVFEEPKNYLWPIPDREILVAPGLTQNPGWF